MRRTILLAGVLPFTSTFLGGILAFSLVVPSVVEAQQAKITAPAFGAAGVDGVERVAMATGPGIRSEVDVNDPSGMPRLVLQFGGQNGTNPGSEALRILGANGEPVGLMGTGGNERPDLRGRLQFADLDGNPRDVASVANEGTPSIVLRDETQTDRIRLSTGPGVKSTVAVRDANGTERANLNTAGETGANPAAAGVNVDDINGVTIAHLGTGSPATPGRAVLRLTDQDENPRLLLTVADDGTPSIQLLDADGNVTWSAQ